MAGRTMALMRLAILSALAALAGFGQQKEDLQFKEAGACARCHVISVVEWGMSAHRRAATGCESCHGASQGHVIDERNNVKPERIPHGEAITTLCAGCHAKGCPKSGHKAGCQTCHHFHALVDPRKPAVAPVESARARPPARRDPGAAKDLARSVRVDGLGTELLLVPGGSADIGSEQFPRARPVHTVRVAPFYLGKQKVTQAEWNSIMGSSSAAGGEAVDRVSWDDAQQLIRKLNERVPGARFRLPTEAEWEFAARAADQLGLLDMLGGGWEWCSSLDRPYPYDAADGREDLSAAGLRILRGASKEDSPLWSGLSARHTERPGRRLRWNGIRLARDIR